MTDSELAQMEERAERAAQELASACEKRDLKEMRRHVKDMLYDGSKKLKHRVPKGARV